MFRWGLILLLIIGMFWWVMNVRIVCVSFGGVLVVMIMWLFLVWCLVNMVSVCGSSLVCSLGLCLSM